MRGQYLPGKLVTRLEELEVENGKTIEAGQLKVPKLANGIDSWESTKETLVDRFECHRNMSGQSSKKMLCKAGVLHMRCRLSAAKNA